MSGGEAFVAVSATVLCDSEGQAAGVMEVLSRAVTGLAFQHGVYGTVTVSQHQGEDDA